MDNDTGCSFVRPCDTRWLSVEGAVSAVDTLKPMIVCFADDAVSGDSTAIGLLKDVSSADFLGTLSASAGVGFCLANLAKDHIFLWPNENLFSIFLTTEPNEIRGLMSI